MTKYFKDSWDAVAYVADLLGNLKYGSQLTTTIIREPSEGYSVTTVTDLSSDATAQELAVLSFLPTQVNT